MVSRASWIHGIASKRVLILIEKRKREKSRGRVISVFSQGSLYKIATAHSFTVNQ